MGQESSVAGEGAQATGGQGQVIQMDARKIAMGWANRISKLDQQQQQQVLAELMRKMPSMHRLVVQILNQMGPGQTAQQSQEANKPLPEAKPPRRTEGPV